MIRRCNDNDQAQIEIIINDGAQAYKGTIPADCWKEPYMSSEELKAEVRNGVEFWGLEEAGALSGVMGIQRVQDVTLIRHAYVRTDVQKRGIGGKLLLHLQTLAQGPVLIGTWQDAQWAIRFYEQYGYRVVDPDQKQELLARYWSVPARQSEVSVVLADASWRDAASNRTTP
jgi:N-acetylglutamate synthase-like GNAT family acetyltransferase